MSTRFSQQNWRGSRQQQWGGWRNSGNSAHLTGWSPPLELPDERSDKRSCHSGFTQVDIAEPPLGGAAKRCFDITAAASALLFLLPLFCLIALAVKLADRGPIFYRHRRIGRNGKPFDCLKFRTMVVDADEVLRRHLQRDCGAAGEWERMRKLTNDPRITSLGTTLRKTSLDELPQLINILKGEMSVVGPRPIVAAEVPKYADCMPHYLRARPGLTGLWQVSGRNEVDYDRRVSLDRHYVENWSLPRDLVIIVRTVGVVLAGRGCY
jgi:exopolysaccharide production protein ExoY